MHGNLMSVDDELLSIMSHRSLVAAMCAVVLEHVHLPPQPTSHSVDILHQSYLHLITPTIATRLLWPLSFWKWNHSHSRVSRWRHSRNQGVGYTNVLILKLWELTVLQFDRRPASVQCWLALSYSDDKPIIALYHNTICTQQVGGHWHQRPVHSMFYPRDWCSYWLL